MAPCLIDLTIVRVLCILAINPISDTWFVNIFPHYRLSFYSVCLFVSFAVQTLFSLILSLVFIFVSVACA